MDDDFKEKCRQRQLGKPSNRKGKTRFVSEEEKYQARLEANRKYKAKIKKIKNGNEGKTN